MNTAIQRIRQDIQSMHAYAIQPSTGLLKLDAMENPHRLSPELQAELRRNEGVYEADMPVELVMTNALAGAYRCTE